MSSSSSLLPYLSWIAIAQRHNSESFRDRAIAYFDKAGIPYQDSWSMNRMLASLEDNQVVNLGIAVAISFYRSHKHCEEMPMAELKRYAIGMILGQRGNQLEAAELSEASSAL